MKRQDRVGTCLAQQHIQHRDSKPGRYVYIVHCRRKIGMYLVEVSTRANTERLQSTLR